MQCELCGWNMSGSDRHTCVECKKVVCASCFKVGGFSDSDRYDILHRINPPKKIKKDILSVLDGMDPRANLCKECLHNKFLKHYIGVFKYGRPD